MGREVRRVPATWEHPKRYDGRYTPLHDGDYASRASEWIANAVAWEAGTHPDAAENKGEHPYWWEWDGMPPARDEYMPSWPDEERTHYQMYETTSEGTPISPVMETPEALARWLADNNASSFGSMTASYDAWLNIARGGWAPSAVSIGGGPLMSGVEASLVSEPR